MQPEVRCENGTVFSFSEYSFSFDTMCSAARMFSTLLVALQGLGFTSKPVASCNTVINHVKELCGFYKDITLDELKQNMQLRSHTLYHSIDAQTQCMF